MIVIYGHGSVIKLVKILSFLSCQCLCELITEYGKKKSFCMKIG